MDRNQVLGGSPLGVLIRLAILSVVVGVVLSALGITPDNIFDRVGVFLRRIYDMGFGAIEWMLSYLLLGAMVVVPIWLLTRVFGIFGSKADDPPPR